MPEIAEHHWCPLPVLADRQCAGRLWVAADEADEPIAFLLADIMADIVDGCLHIEQVSVHPGSARRGLGAGCWTTSATWQQQTVFPH